MIFVLYGGYTGVGYASREFFRKNGFVLIQKYHYCDSTPKLSTFYETRNFVDELTFYKNTDAIYRYQIGNIQAGFSKIQIDEVLSNNYDCLITLATDQIGIIKELKATYGNKVQVIYLFTEESVLNDIFRKMDISEEEFAIRCNIGKKIKAGYSENTFLFDYTIVYGGEASLFNCENIEKQCNTFYLKVTEQKDNNASELLSCVQGIKKAVNELLCKNQSLIESSKMNADAIINKLEEMRNIIIPVLDFVTEQKKKLPDNNALQYLSEEQIEEIQVRFIDETAKKIVEKMDYDAPSVEKEESLLKGMFGVYWEKLDEYTRKSLLSAKILFNNCQRAEYASLDHSGIVIAATSALENELKRRFFIGFQQYLTKKKIKCSEWPNVLVFFKKSGECVPNANFELGSFKYIIKCPEKDKPILNEYLQQILLEQYSTKDVSVFTNKGNNMPSFLERCEDIRISFRNPAAHIDPVGRSKAEACCNTIIGSKDASEEIGKIQGLLYDLVRMTDKFN